MAPASKHHLVRVLVLFVCLAIAGQAVQAQAKRVARHVQRPSKPIVEIIDSGSTNTAGYVIWVTRDGQARYQLLTPRTSGDPLSSTVPPLLAARLFKDVTGAQPLDRHAAADCVKSGSFGTTLRVKFAGTLSPDISCPGVDAQLKAVYEDARDVVKALKLNTRIEGQ